jgi:hypothetical protein
MPFLHDTENPRDLALRDSLILRQFDVRLKPHLQLAGSRLYVHVHALFLA